MTLPTPMHPDQYDKSREAEIFAIGDIVETAKGAKFWGEIIAFDGDKASPGCTVRAIDGSGFDGTKHVYPVKQLRRRALIQPTPAETAAELYHLRNTVENLKDNLHEVETRPTTPPIGDGEGDLVARLRRGVARNPKLEVVWVQNMRAFLKEEMFRTFPEWRSIFASEFEMMLAASAEAATVIESLSRQLEEAREALKRGRAKAQELHEYWATERDREFAGATRRDIAETAVLVTSEIKRALVIPEANNPGRP